MIAAVDNSKKILTPTGAAVNRASTPADIKDSGEPNAGREVGQTLATKAMEMGKGVAHKGVNVLADAATHHAEEKARHALRFMVLNRLRDLGSAFAVIPGGEILLKGIIANFFFPYYQQVNPETKMTAEHISASLIHGHMDTLENEVFETLDKFISSNLKEEERAKYEAGDKLVVIKAFKNLTMSQFNIARQPGGIKKICNSIANFIPLINKLPAAVKPWTGGAIGLFVAYKLARLALYMAKKALWLIGGILGIKFLINKFGGGVGAASGLPTMPAMHGHGEEASAEGGGGETMMGKLMKGASKLAEVAAQAQGAGGGHGAPGGGGGLAQALSALAGAGGGGGH